MRPIRFTIASLLVVVLVTAFGFAAIRESNDVWDSGVFSLTLSAMLLSILLAIHRRGSRRAFWLGFALFGSGYLALSLVPAIESRLMSTKVLAYLDSKVPGRSLANNLYTLLNGRIGGDNLQAVTFAPDGNQLAISSQSGVVRIWDIASGKPLGGWGGTTENFVRIGHSLFALLAGWLGGLLSRRFCQSSVAGEPSTPSNASGTTP